MLQGKNILFARLCHRKFVTIGEYFMHKWRHVLCVMTSPAISPLSILKRWIHRGLTALRLKRSELNLIPVVRFRVAGRTNHQIFIKARLGAQLSMRTWVLLICVWMKRFLLLLLLFFIWKDEHQELLWWGLLKNMAFSRTGRHIVLDQSHAHTQSWTSNSNSDGSALVTWLLDVRG